MKTNLVHKTFLQLDSRGTIYIPADLGEHVARNPEQVQRSFNNVFGFHFFDQITGTVTLDDGVEIKVKSGAFNTAHYYFGGTILAIENVTAQCKDQVEIQYWKNRLKKDPDLLVICDRFGHFNIWTKSSSVAILPDQKL